MRLAVSHTAGSEGSSVFVWPVVCCSAAMRPPRQLRKDAALKRSATTLAMRTHAAGLRHMLLVSFEGDEFDQALAHAVSAERARALRGMRVSRVRRPAAPSASASAATAAAWLAGAIIPSSRRNIGADMFVVPESLVSFAPVRLTADAQSQLRPWAEAIHRCALVYSAQGGLELVARVSFRVGDSVIRGYVDCEVFDDASAVVSGGTLLGPLSYLNSACATHANVRWSGGHSGWVGRALRAIRVGEPLCACYDSGGVGVLSCAVCAALGEAVAVVEPRWGG